MSINNNNLKVIERDIIDIDKRIKLAERSLDSVEITDYPTISNITSVINRMQGEKTSLLKLRHSIEQDVIYKNEETQVKIDKLKVEIDRIAQTGNLDKIDLLIKGLSDIASEDEVDTDENE